MAWAVPDVLDPLYINPSDTPRLNLINEHLIGTENYGNWSRAMLIALQSKNKPTFVDGICKRPTSEPDKMPHWERCNAIVLSWIMNTVSKEIFSGIVYSTDAAVVWNDSPQQPSAPAPPSCPLRRSVRTSRPPIWSHDYICTPLQSSSSSVH